jgi:hypothetical protein
LQPLVRVGRTIAYGNISGLDSVIRLDFKADCASAERSIGRLKFSGKIPLTIFYYYKIFLFYNNRK